MSMLLLLVMQHGHVTASSFHLPRVLFSDAVRLLGGAVGVCQLRPSTHRLQSAAAAISLSGARVRCFPHSCCQMESSAVWPLRTILAAGALPKAAVLASPESSANGSRSHRTSTNERNHTG